MEWRFLALDMACYRYPFLKEGVHLHHTEVELTSSSPELEFFPWVYRLAPPYVGDPSGG